MPLDFFIQKSHSKRSVYTLFNSFCRSNMVIPQKPVAPVGTPHPNGRVARVSTERRIRQRLRRSVGRQLRHLLQLERSAGSTRTDLRLALGAESSNVPAPNPGTREEVEATRRSFMLCLIVSCHPS